MYRMKKGKARVNTLTSMEGKGGNVEPVTFLLKVAMHCLCIGCTKKIRKGMESITNFRGVERVEPNMESGEVKVEGRLDPEKLRDWLHNKINKKVDLVYPNDHIEEPQITYPAPSAPPISYVLDSLMLPSNAHSHEEQHRGSNRQSHYHICN